MSRVDQSAPVNGMTLRDWFAGMSSGIPSEVPLSHFESLVGRPYEGPFGSLQHWNFVADAEAAFKLLQADALIAARWEGSTP